MKKIYFLFVCLCIPFITNAQCFVQLQHTDELCFGDCNASANAFPVGTGPFAYLWNPGNMTSQNVTGLCAGNYTLTVIDQSNGCVATATFVVTQPTLLTTNGNSGPASCATCCDGFAYCLGIGGTSPYTYAWTGPNGFTSNQPTIANLCVGTYTCCVTDANNCTTCSTFTVTFSTGINGQSSPSNFSISPNPALDYVSVNANFDRSTTSTISICNLLGEVLIVKNFDSTNMLHETINISNLPSGIYFACVKGSGVSSTQRFVKQ